VSKPKYGNSNLYMTPREFADLVVEALYEQSYFKEDEVAHPGDIAIAFSTVGETVGTTMSWAIRNEKISNVSQEKLGYMQTGSLKKSADSNIPPTSTESNNYSEWKINKEMGYL
jgi:hypothetical protein